MNKIKIYRGFRKNGEPIVLVEELGLAGVKTRFLVNTKEGYTFEWGYMGEGPSDLARSILMDMQFPEKEVNVLYHLFKQDFVLPANWDGFEISEDHINAWWDFKHHSEEDEEGGDYDGFV